jgi:two-component system LytT family sensor kinase
MHSASINLPDILFTQLPSIYVFYGSCFIFFNYLFRKRVIPLLIAECVFFCSYLIVTYINGYVIAPLVNPADVIPPFNFSVFLLAGVWVFFIYSYFAFGYYFARRTIMKEKQLRETERKKLQAEQEKLEAEYAFLRAQINPHFLHNTLNFFYAKSLGCSQELSDSILTLSEIMRYSLEGGEDDNGTVLLSKEVEHLQKVIRINQLRFSNRLQVQFTTTGNIDSVRMIPLILITLVENAFKHGELTNAQHPLILRLEISDDNAQLHFMTFNRKKAGPKELSHGIGMDNIRKRLECAYKDNYTLAIKDEDDFYTTHLVIALAGLVTEEAPAAGPKTGSMPSRGELYNLNYKIKKNDQLFNS